MLILPDTPLYGIFRSFNFCIYIQHTFVTVYTQMITLTYVTCTVCITSQQKILTVQKITVKILTLEKKKLEWVPIFSGYF